MTSRDAYMTNLSLDEAKPALERVAGEHGLYLDFLMRRWNGRFATYNLGLPDPKGDPRDGGRSYRLIGRVKANAQPTGRVAWVFSPPTACDPAATADDEARYDCFREALIGALRLEEV